MMFKVSSTYNQKFYEDGLKIIHNDLPARKTQYFNIEH